jgi:hypothetical protein
MLFQRINRSDPEKVFIVVKNSYLTASLTNGQAVCWDWTTDADGVSVSIPTATENVAGGTDFAGVAAETIAHNAYGLIQVYGYHSAAKVRTMTATGHVYHESRGAVAAGTRLVAGITAAFVLEGVTVAATAQVLDPAGFSFAACATFTSAATAIFIKAL